MGLRCPRLALLCSVMLVLNEVARGDNCLQETQVAPVSVAFSGVGASGDYTSRDCVFQNGLTFAFGSSRFHGRILIAGGESSRIVIQQIVCDGCNITIEGVTILQKSGQYGLFVDRSVFEYRAVYIVRNTQVTCSNAFHCIYVENTDIRDESILHYVRNVVSGSVDAGFGDAVHPIEFYSVEMEKGELIFDSNTVLITQGGSSNIWCLLFDGGSVVDSSILLFHNYFSGSGGGTKRIVSLRTDFTGRSQFAMTGNTLVAAGGTSNSRILWEVTERFLAGTTVAVSDNIWDSARAPPFSFQHGGAVWVPTSATQFVVRCNRDGDDSPISPIFVPTQTLVACGVCKVSADCVVSNTMSVFGYAPMDCTCMCSGVRTQFTPPRCESALLTRTPTSSGSGSRTCTSSRTESSTVTRKTSSRSYTSTRTTSSSHSNSHMTQTPSISTAPTRSGSRSLSLTSTESFGSPTVSLSQSTSLSHSPTRSGATPTVSSSAQLTRTNSVTRSPSETRSDSDASRSGSASVHTLSGSSTHSYTFTLAVSSTFTSSGRTATTSWSRTDTLTTVRLVPSLAHVEASAISRVAKSANTSEHHVAFTLNVSIRGDHFDATGASHHSQKGLQCVGISVVEHEGRSRSDAKALTSYFNSSSIWPVDLVIQDPRRAFLTFTSAPDFHLDDEVLLTVSVMPQCLGRRHTPPTFNLTIRRSSTAVTMALAQAVAESKVAATVGVMMGSLTGSPIIATQLARSSLVLGLIHCEADAGSLSPLQSPTQLALGSGPFSFYYGGSLLNHFVIITVPALQATVGLLYSQIRRVPLVEGFGFVRFPSISMFPLLLLIEPTVMCATVTTVFGSGAFRGLGAASLLLGCLTPLMCFIAMRRRGASFFFDGSYDEDAHPLLRFLMGKGKWLDSDNGRKTQACQRFRMYFQDYTADRFHFMCVEIVMCVACGAVDGLKLWAGHCGSVLVAFMTILLTFLVVIALFRPYSAPFLLMFSLGMTLVQLLGGIFVAIYAFGDDHDEKMVEYAEWTTIVAMYMLAGRSLFDMYPLVKKVIYFFNPSLRRSHRRRTRKMREAEEALLNHGAGQLEVVELQDVAAAIDVPGVDSDLGSILEGPRDDVVVTYSDGRNLIEAVNQSIVWDAPLKGLLEGDQLMSMRSLEELESFTDTQLLAVVLARQEAASSQGSTVGEVQSYSKHKMRLHELLHRSWSGTSSRKSGSLEFAREDGGNDGELLLHFVSGEFPMGDAAVIILRDRMRLQFGSTGRSEAKKSHTAKLYETIIDELELDIIEGASDLHASSHVNGLADAATAAPATPVVSNWPAFHQSVSPSCDSDLALLEQLLADSSVSDGECSPDSAS